MDRTTKTDAFWHLPDIERWLGDAPRCPSLRDAISQKFHDLGICTLSPANASVYPFALKHVIGESPQLFFRGEISHLKRPVVAIIGSRKASALGMKMAFSLANHLTRCGFSIVSGLARGIDTAALKGAVISKDLAPAIAILGTAITRCYPAENFAFFSFLCQKGCVISQYPPWMTTLPHHFILRNKLIAAMADGIIIIEASEKSGAFHTVHAALELGKPIFVADLPAPGNQKLRDDGAIPIRKIDEALITLCQHMVKT